MRCSQRMFQQLCQLHACYTVFVKSMGESFDESWASDDASSDITQPDRYPTDSTAVSGSVAIREALVDYFNN